MSNLLEKDDRNGERAFALKVSRALNESLRGIPPGRLEQLAMARKAALRAQKRPLFVAQVSTRTVVAGVAGGASSAPRRFGRLGLTASVLILVAGCLIGIFHVEQQRHIDELADLDTALLTDEIPISTYADHGFNAYIKQNQ